MNAVRAAVDANNAGVSLIEIARYDDAIDVFRSAADLMYEVTQIINDGSAVKAGFGAGISENDSSTVQKIREAQEKVNKINALNLNPNQPSAKPPFETDCFLHIRGFTLSISAEDNIASCAIHSATILTNMALAHHLAVPQGLRSSVQAFRSALTLYEMAYSVALRVDQSEHSSRIVMVALNNMGSIHHDCVMFNKSRQILNLLQEFIRNQDKSADHTFCAEKRIYLLNAMVLVRAREAPAA